MENMFDFKKIGPGYLFCLNEQCPKREECIRYLAGQHTPDDLLIGTTVLPAAYRNRQCKYFKQANIVEYAYGFEHIYDKVMRKDYTEMRKQLTSYLGNTGHYYRYKHGEEGLNPKQQQYIRNLFAKFGYTEPVVFDRYVRQYDF